METKKEKKVTKKISKPKSDLSFGFRLLYAFLNITIIALIVFIVFTNNNLSKQSGILANDINTQEDTIVTLNQRLEDKTTAVSDESKNTDEHINSAKESGEEIARLQNKYVGSNFEEGEKIAEELSPYFDTIENTGTSVLPNGRWFDDINYETGGKPVWTFNTPYGFTGHSINTIWLCYDDKSGELLAYTTAVYNADTGLYSNVEITGTQFGMEAMKTNTDTSTSVKDQVIEDSDRYIEAMGGIK